MPQRKKGKRKDSSKSSSKSRATKARAAPADVSATPEVGTSGTPAAEDIDRLAREGGKSKWMDDSDSPAGTPLTAEEKRGINLLGRSSVRDDAIPGVADSDMGEE